MCVPVMAVMAAVAVAGAAVSAAGTISSAHHQKQAAEAEATYQKKTAHSQMEQAADVSSAQLMKSKQVGASQAAAFGASGISPSSGTPLNLEAQTAELGELDRLRIINNAQRTAWGYNTQAGITQWQGDQAVPAAYMQAGGTLLSSASSAYFGFKKASG